MMLPLRSIEARTMISTFLDEIANTLARAEAAAYERGKEDGRQECLDELIANARARQQAARQDTEPQAPRNNVRPAGGARPAFDRRRAPRGSVRELIRRALSSRPGLVPADILAEAETDYERMIQPASVRNELRRGRAAGRYRRSRGHWYLAEAGNDEAEGNPSQDQPSASNSSQGGSDDRTALDEDGDLSVI